MEDISTVKNKDKIKFLSLPFVETERNGKNRPEVSPAVTNYPSPIADALPQMTPEEKIDYIAERFEEIMKVLGLDLADQSLARTPQRVAKMYVKEIFSGLNVESFPEISFIDDEYTYNDQSNMVFVTVNFHSFCEHHFVPMIGTAFVAYLPNGKLIGLSKIPRIVKFFASRPQVQERLGAQIADCLSILLETDSVAVSLTAQHFCVIARGIEDTHSNTTTNVLRGEFFNNDIRRHEFFDGIHRDNSSR